MRSLFPSCCSFRPLILDGAADTEVKGSPAAGRQSMLRSCRGEDGEGGYEDPRGPTPSREKKAEQVSSHLSSRALQSNSLLYTPIVVVCTGRNRGL